MTIYIPNLQTGVALWNDNYASVHVGTFEV